MLYKWKSFLSILLILLAALGLGFVVYYYQSPIQKSIDSRTFSKGYISDLVLEDYTDLYLAILEYDPKTDLVAQLKTANIKGEVPYLFSNQPMETPVEFVYKVEVVSSSNNKILLAGWNKVYKEIAQTEQGKISIRILVPIYSQSVVKVYLPNNKLIWTGKML